MHPAFARLDHRPWPPPGRPWVGRQTWHDLLFAHWPLSVAAVRRLVPEGLNIDQHQGTTWVGVVPFRMSGAAPRGVPDVPGLSAFPELNARLYVERDGKPGVWFLSLDAASAAAVWGARRFFHLPYFHARMNVNGSEEIAYASERRSAPVRFTARYRPDGPAVEPRPGTLEYFLTERYCLYAQAPDASLRRLEIHHRPWPLQPAVAELTRNELLAPHGLEVSGAPLLHFARRQDMVMWLPERLT
jgi:uncharacterized protein YqjF (DUF2071 family)